MALDPESEKLLAELDPRLAKVLRLARDYTPFSWRVVQTARTIEQQRTYFREGKSKVNPDAYQSMGDLYAAAKHITGPGMPKSRAADLAIVGKEPYNEAALTYLAGIIRCIAQQLGLKVRWGGDFDRDGVLLETGTFKDLPHHEIDE